MMGISKKVCVGYIRFEVQKRKFWNDVRLSYVKFSTALKWYRFQYNFVCGRISTKSRFPPPPHLKFEGSDVRKEKHEVTVSLKLAQLFLLKICL